MALHQTLFAADDALLGVVRPTLAGGSSGDLVATYEPRSQDGLARMLSFAVSQLPPTLDPDDDVTWVRGQRRGVLDLPPLPPRPKSTRHQVRTVGTFIESDEVKDASVLDSARTAETGLQHTVFQPSHFHTLPAADDDEEEGHQEVESIMVRGSNGLAKWVTMATGKEAGLEADVDATAEDHRIAMLNLARTVSQLHQGAAVPLPPLPGSAPSAQPTPAAATLPLSNRASPGDTAPGAASSLWISRHAPRNFAELLSDESVNLDVLRWLKSWHTYVAATQTQSHPASGRGDAAQQEDLAITSSATVAALRPEEKFVLITGPPGVGKTTLAHIVARHCGFEPVEINASAERTAKELEHIIISTVSNVRCRIPKVLGPMSVNQPTPTDATNTTQPRQSHDPSTVVSDGSTAASRKLMAAKCLIIDEMDGITANVVSLLLKQDIHRPVICLANNLYAPALRELRSAARLIFAVPPINHQRLAARLDDIVRKEGHVVPKSTLTELTHISNGDVRCCLNTLQFLCRLGTSRDTVGELLEKMKLKDATLGLWSIWTDMFQRKERSKYHQQHGAGSSSSVGDPVFQHVRALAMNCGDMETLMDGAYQFYPLQRYADYTFRHTACVAQSFAFLDRLTSLRYGTSSSGSTSTDLGLLERYFPVYLAAELGMRCSVLTKPSGIGFPRDAKDAREKQASLLGSLRAFVQGVDQTPPLEVSMPMVAVHAETKATAVAPPVMPVTPAKKRPSMAEATREAHVLASSPSEQQRLGTPSRTPRPSRHADMTEAPLHAPSLLPFHGVDAAAMDVAPLFVRCLAPSFKLPLHFTGLSSLPPVDRPAFDHLVSRLATYGVSFREKVEQPQPTQFGGHGGWQQRGRGGGRGGAGSWTAGGAGRGSGTAPPSATMDQPTTTARHAMEPDLEAFVNYKAIGAGLTSKTLSVVGAGGVFVDVEAQKQREREALKTAGGPKPYWQLALRHELRAVLVGEVKQAVIRRRAATTAATRARVAAGQQQQHTMFHDAKKRPMTPPPDPAGAMAGRSTSPVAKKGPMPEAAVAQQQQAPTAAKGGIVAVGVKKDFFGRPIVAAAPAPTPADAGAAPSTPKKDGLPPPPQHPGSVPPSPSAAAGGTSSGGGAIAAATKRRDQLIKDMALKYTVKYVYSDGATNAIKRNATINDFLLLEPTGP